MDATRPALDLSGPWRATPADDDLRRTSLAAMDDTTWAHVTVPGQWRSSPAFADLDDPLLYRRTFSTAALPPDPDGRDWLVLDGVFYTADVWLDDAYLGDAEGYFFAQSFEVTEPLRSGHDHVLALEVACTPPGDRTAKRNLTGVFQHGDLLDRHGNPGGIWAPVRIERSGPVRIAHSRILCRSARVDRSTLGLRVVLDAATSGDVTIRTTVVRPDGTELVDARNQPLATGENRVEWTVDVPDPERWWPWALGDQPMHEVRVDVVLPDGRHSDGISRSIGLREVALQDWILWVNGERLFVKGSNHGPTRAALSEASPEEVAADVGLAREAGLDLLRVHAHVARPELYDAADAAGLLLWQDMPLQWGYHRSIRRQARRQTRELVDVLGHHPSVVIWCGHEAPLAIDVTPQALADPARRSRLVARVAAAQLLPTWNKSVLDHSIARVFHHSDGTRPVVPHSGVLPHLPQLSGTDAHLSFGWYHGDERDLAGFLRRWPRMARFVSEFGAQAVPDDFDELDAEAWPALDWDDLWDRHGLQHTFFEQHVPPSAYATLDLWVEATQRYQATVVRRQIEVLRRLKYRPTGGFAQFFFADASTGVSWSVLDHRRRPKLGFEALRQACRPVVVVADRLPATVAPGDHLHLDVHAVSDARIAVDDMVVTAVQFVRSLDDTCPTPLALARMEQETTSTASAESDHLGRWQGALPADACVKVATMHVDVPVDGAGHVLIVDLEISGGGHRGRNRYVAPIIGGPHTS